MKKAEFIQAVSEKAGLSKKDSQKAVDAALEAMQAKLKLLEDQLLASETEKALVEKQLNENIATFNTASAAMDASASTAGGGTGHVQVILELKENIERLQQKLEQLVNSHAATMLDSNSTIASLEVGQRVLTSGIRYEYLLKCRYICV